MGVKLDFSKAQPVEEAKPVTLDFSKAQHLSEEPQFQPKKFPISLGTGPTAPGKGEAPSDEIIDSTGFGGNYQPQSIGSLAAGAAKSVPGMTGGLTGFEQGPNGMSPDEMKTGMAQAKGPQNPTENAGRLIGETAQALPGIEGLIELPGAVARGGRGLLRMKYAARVRSEIPEAANLPDQAIHGVEKVFRGAAPTGTKIEYKANLYDTAHDLADIGRDVEQRLKNVAGGVANSDLRTRAVYNATGEHLKTMYEVERAPQIQAVAKNVIEVPMNKNARMALNDLSMASADAGTQQLAARAKSGKLSMEDADKLAMAVNKRLRKFESMTPEQQTVAFEYTHAGMKNLDQMLSKGINGELRANGMPGLEAYEKAYAQISRVREQIGARINSGELDVPGVIKTVTRKAGSLMSKGKSGIAGASQAAISDEKQGKLLQEGLSELAKTDLTAKGRRPVWKLTTPPGRTPGAPQATQAALPHAGSIPTNVDPAPPLKLEMSPGRVGAVGPNAQEQLQHSQGLPWHEPIQVPGPEDAKLASPGRMPPEAQRPFPFAESDVHPGKRNGASDVLSGKKKGSKKSKRTVLRP